METGSLLLACGPYFNEDDATASIAILLVFKPIVYFAFIRAFRYRVCRAIPMTFRQAAKLAALRSGLGVVFVGGGALALLYSGSNEWVLASWIYLYASRLAAWWWIGSVFAGLKGKRLVAWVFFGMLINTGFDVSFVAGLFGGWVFPALQVAVALAFIAVLDKLGRRASLRARFSSDPLCMQCQYNLTGNLSGVCPECGTPISNADSETLPA